MGLPIPHKRSGREHLMEMFLVVVFIFLRLHYSLLFNHNIDASDLLTSLKTSTSGVLIYGTMALLIGKIKQRGAEAHQPGARTFK